MMNEPARAAEVYGPLLEKAKTTTDYRLWADAKEIEKLDNFEWPKVFRDALTELAAKTR